MSLESATYIKFEPDRPGIVLDVSEGGLRFRVLSPMQERQKVHFWFSAEGEQVEANGEVRWMDERRLEGGLCFKFVSPHTREQIRKWMIQTGPMLAAEQSVTRQMVSQAKGSKAAPDGAAALTKIGVIERRSQLKSRTPVKVFSEGLVSGLIISAIMAGGILFHIGRNRLGELFVAIGRGLAAEPANLSGSATSVPDGRTETDLPNAWKKIRDKKRSDISLSEAPVIVAGIAEAAPLPMFAIPRGPMLISPRSIERRESEPLEAINNGEETAKIETESDLGEAPALAGVGSTKSGANKYFDVRAFRKGGEADKTKDTLEQFGFHASVIRKGRLWMSSYHVMVGPYGNDSEAEAAWDDLEARGYQPMSSGRRSRRFVLPPMTLADQDAVVRDCIIAWDANSSAATVTFLKEGKAVFQAQGTWVKRNVTYKLDAALSSSEGRGPSRLLEIQCHGMNQALVFDSAKPIRYFIPSFRPAT